MMQEDMITGGIRGNRESHFSNDHHPNRYFKNHHHPDLDSQSSEEEFKNKREGAIRKK